MKGTSRKRMNSESQSTPGGPRLLATRPMTVPSAPLEQIQIRRTRHSGVARSDNHAFGSSRSDHGFASRHAFGTAPKYPTTHTTCAVDDEGDGSLCKARVCQPGWEHQGPLRLLDPQAGGRAR